MNRVLHATISAVVVGLVVPAAARAQVGGALRDPGVRSIAALVPGSLEGTVLDDRGIPVSGASISAVGPTNALAIADPHGHFNVRSLPPGPYLVRAHQVGYTPSRRQFIEVRAATRTTVSVNMRRTDGARMLAAGLVPEGGTEDPVADPAGTGGDDHSELAWRLRHMPRGVLKETTDRVVLADDFRSADGSSFLPGGFTGLAHAVGSSARFASDLFGNLSLTGEVNLLTAGAFDNPTELFSADRLSRGVAFFSLRGLAGGRGNWSVQAMMTQADLGSWLVAGTYEARPPAEHQFEIGTSYSVQRYVSAKGDLTLPSSEGSRAAGSVYFFDHWTLSPRATLTYGARYAHYDYMDNVGLFSPRVSLSLVPYAHTRVVAAAAQKMLAPGAEEFMPALAQGLWVPPARSFQNLSGAPFTAERTMHVEFGVERDLPHAYVLSVRGFYQRTEDQQGIVFGGSLYDPQAVSSHYYIGDLGEVRARGWSVGVSNMLAAHVRGSVTYELVKADWAATPDLELVALLAPSTVRSPVERFHDVSTSLETDIPATATRFVVLYKVNTAFGRSTDARPGLGGRFDVQVTQGLPFLNFTSTQWRVLVAVRNLFRDPAQFGSVYDELLVVQPPKRIVGGVLVRF